MIKDLQSTFGDLHFSRQLTVLQGHVLTKLREIADESVHCVITSPPYWGLRDYGANGQLGLEETFSEYLSTMVDVFQEVRRVLRSDGTLWLNLGDTYHSGNRGGYERGSTGKQSSNRGTVKGLTPNRTLQPGLKPKDLVGIPWRVAFALQDSGWFLRSDIVWRKPNPMPESARDRPTREHEYLFLLSKSERYYYNAKAIREPVSGTANPRGQGVNRKIAGWREGPGSHSAVDHAKPSGHGATKFPRPRQNPSFSSAVRNVVEFRNKRSVWTVAPARFKGAHFATFPPKLVEPCVLAGCPSAGVVLDPFAGSGTTGMVALQHSRRAVLIELQESYLPMIAERCAPYLETP